MLSAVPPANYSSFHSGLDWVDMPERIADSVKPRLSLPSILATTVGSWYSAPTTSWKSLHSSSTSSRRSCEVHPAPCQNIWFFKGEIERSSVRINIHILSHTHAHTRTHAHTASAACQHHSPQCRAFAQNPRQGGAHLTPLRTTAGVAALAIARGMSQTLVAAAAAAAAAFRCCLPPTSSLATMAAQERPHLPRWQLRRGLQAARTS